MKALIIGGAGFVGKYLIDELQNFGYEVCATCLPNEKINAECDVFNLDIMEQKSISELLEKTSPDFVFHLAAQSSVAFSWKNPQLTVDVNIKGTVNLLEAFRFYERNSRLIVIGSGEEYGFIDKNSVPLKESEKLNPANVYAVTKACQEMLCGIYVRAYGKDIVMTRSFNHSGAGQSDTFVISDFCRQIAEIETSWKSLQYLAIGIIFLCMTFPVFSLLQAIGRADIPVKVMLFGVAVKFVGNLLLIPHFYTAGAGMSTSICYLVILILAVYHLRKTLGEPLHLIGAMTAQCYSSMMCGVSAWLCYGKIVMMLPQRIAFIGAVFVGAMVYVICLFLTQGKQVIQFLSRSI